MHTVKTLHISCEYKRGEEIHERETREPPLSYGLFWRGQSGLWNDLWYVTGEECDWFALFLELSLYILLKNFNS